MRTAASTWVLAIALLGLPSLASAQEAAATADATVAAPDSTAAAPDTPVAVNSTSPDAVVSDPWEGFNRNMFAVHEGVDKAVLEPVARGYRAVTPGFFRTGVSNFLFNLRSPVIFANDVLQGEGERAATTFARFGVNSTVGILGVMDVASHMGLERHDEDFGQTLAVWGVDSGPYLFIPVLGPTNVRDGFGKVVDFFIDPLTYAEFEGDDTFRTSRTVLTGLSAREALLDTVDDIRQNSLDPYVSYRTSYELLRESAISNGADDALPEFDDPIADAEPVETPAAATETLVAPVVSEASSGPVQTASR